MAILLPMLLLNCRSTRTVQTEKTYVPEIEFPVFPEAESLERNGERVSGEAEWFVRLAEFRIKYERAVKDYNMIKDMYEVKNDAE